MSSYDFDILRLGHAGYCCAQIIVQMGLEVQGAENHGLLRAMAGLCHGVAGSQGSCGALTGAACLVAYHAGKGRAEEESDERLPLMLAELTDWFAATAGARFGGITCADIVSDGRPDMAVCGELVAGCYGAALRILGEHGFDPSNPRND